MNIQKWQALGNDYLVAEEQELPWEVSPNRIRLLCDRHFGVGSDGLLLVGPPLSEAAVASLRIFNPDGTEAELSGNGARQAALFLADLGWTDSETFVIDTKGGLVEPTILSEHEVRMSMGAASPSSDELLPGGSPDGIGELDAAGTTWTYQFHAVGNPQCAIRVDDGLEELDLSELGPAIERHEIFPQRTNVSFWALEERPDGRTGVRARIFERGVGETLASGTGACGAALAAWKAGAESPLIVRLDGGELMVAIDDEAELTLTGEAEKVFTAELTPELCEALEAERVPPSLGGPP